MKKWIFNSVLVILLITFTIDKVVELHNYEHIFDDQNAIENCNSCEFYAKEDTSSFILTPVFIWEPRTTPTYNKDTFSSFIQDFSTENSEGQYYNKPPPLI